MEIERGAEYVVRDAGFLGDHLDSQLVTALEDGGPGMFQTHEIEVRCHHCNEIFRVDVDRLR